MLKNNNNYKNNLENFQCKKVAYFNPYNELDNIGNLENTDKLNMKSKCNDKIKKQK